MQSKPEQIATNFAPDTQFEVETKSMDQTFEISDLLSLPLEEQPLHISPNLTSRRGIPFSPIHD
jgi:hypothetical protein